MGKENLPTPEDRFEKTLKTAEQQNVQEWDAQLKERIDFATRYGMDQGKLLESNLKVLYRQKADEITNAIKLLRGVQTGETKEAQESYLLQRYQATLTSLTSRFDLLMQVVGGKGKTVSTEQEILDFKNVYKLLEAIDANTLILGTGMNASYFEAIGKSVTPDYIDILERATLNKLTEDDYKLLRDEIRALTNKKLSALRESAAVVLLSQIKPADRLKVMQGLMDEPNVENLLANMVAGGYLTVDQADFLIEEKQNPLKQAKKPDETRLAQLEKAKTDISSPEMQKVQDQVAKAKKKGVKMMHRQFGHKNRARELLSLKGIGSMLLFANGCLTVAANVLVNLEHPLGIVTSPGTWLGVGMTAGGLEWSRGFAGLLPTPSKAVAKVAKEKDEATDQAQKKVIEAMQNDLGNNPLAAEFYVSYGEKIFQAYAKKSKDSGRVKVDLKLEDLGLDYEKLPEKFKKVSKENLEATISKWAWKFALKSEPALGVAMSAQVQQKFINDSRRLRGLPEFETKTS